MLTILTYRRTRTALAVTGVLALMAASGQAAAAVYAGSKMSISELVILTTDSAGNITPPTGFNFFSTNTAVLNNVGDIQADACTGTAGGAPADDDCGPVGARLDALQAWAPGATGAVQPGENDFTFIGPTGTQQFARSDSNVPTAEIPGFNEGVVEPSSTNNLSEAELLTLPVNGNASASAEIGSTTGLNFNFSISPGGDLGPSSPPVTVEISFLAEADGFVEIRNEAEPVAIADAEFSFVTTLRLDDTNFVRWAPNGNGSSDCVVVGLVGVTCVASDGGEDLNQQIDVVTIPSSGTIAANGAFSVTISGLSAGDFSLNLTEFKTVSVSNGTVPAPGVLSLLGIGLFGLGWVKRGGKSL